MKNPLHFFVFSVSIALKIPRQPWKFMDSFLFRSGSDLILLFVGAIKKRWSAKTIFIKSSFGLIRLSFFAASAALVWQIRDGNTINAKKWNFFHCGDTRHVNRPRYPKVHRRTHANTQRPMDKRWNENEMKSRATSKIIKRIFRANKLDHIKKKFSTKV